MRRKRLPRSVRIVRNFALSLVLLAAFWILLGVPPLTRYGAFRRLEAEYLLTPSQLVYRSEGDYESAYLAQGEGWLAAGLVEKLDNGTRASITHVLPCGERHVFPLPARDGKGNTVLVLSGAPAEAATGELTLTLEGVEVTFNAAMILAFHRIPERESFTARAARGEDGYYFFYLEPHNHPEDELCALEALWGDAALGGIGSWPYRLTLWDSQGGIVLEESGMLEGRNVNLRS